MNHRACLWTATIAVAVLLAACAPGSGKGLNVSGRPLSEGEDVPLAATLESIQVNVFDAACVVCHSGAAAPLGLRLESGSSFVNLVGVRSSQVGSLLRVDPGDPDRSYLVRKLEGTSSEGAQMPLGGPPIPQATIDFVRQWISDGAPPESQQPPGQPPAVISMSPAPDSSSADFPAQVTLGFDRDIDASTVNSATVTLLRAGGDGAFGDANDVEVVPAAVGLSPTNPRLAVMGLTGTTPVADRYRVTARGTGPNVILSVDGVAPDGDFIADFVVAGLQPTLDSIQANVFSPSCALSGCHSGPPGGGLPQGMDLSSADASFASLVNVISSQAPLTARVLPFDADNSYLVHKLEGTQAVGGQMPAAGPPLDAATIDVIRTWIDNGADR
jgi:hypothetical protein